MHRDFLRCTETSLGAQELQSFLQVASRAALGYLIYRSQKILPSLYTFSTCIRIHLRIRPRIRIAFALAFASLSPSDLHRFRPRIRIALTLAFALAFAFAFALASALAFALVFALAFALTFASISLSVSHLPLLSHRFRSCICLCICIALAPAVVWWMCYPESLGGEREGRERIGANAKRNQGTMKTPKGAGTR